MNIRIDDDMRAIVSLTPDEYEALGGEKEPVAFNIERAVTDLIDGHIEAEPSAEEPKPEPVGAPEPPAVAALDAPVN